MLWHCGHCFIEWQFNHDLDDFNTTHPLYAPGNDDVAGEDLPTASAYLRTSSCEKLFEFQLLVFAAVRLFASDQGRDETQRKTDRTRRAVPILGLFNRHPQQGDVGIVLALRKPNRKLRTPQFGYLFAVANQPGATSDRNVILILRIGK